MSNGAFGERSDESWAASLGEALAATLVSTDELEETLRDVKHRARSSPPALPIDESDLGNSLADSLSVSVQMIGDITLIKVSGEVDVYSVGKLKSALSDCLNHGRHQLVLDIDGIEFLDSTGLGPMMGALAAARRRGGFMLLVCSTEKILKIFRLTGLWKVVPIHASLDDALTAVEDLIAQDQGESTQDG
ncbi:STAS domain-containing protein [Streptomyces europaeiscabiei]|uniref:STAS domain-containing protein n=1 Tax=Streptomyces europaeiscabiei TaxID=146819 RepID=UPI0038F7EF30